MPKYGKSNLPPVEGPRGDLDGEDPSNPFAGLAPTADSPFVRWFGASTAPEAGDKCGRPQPDDPPRDWDRLHLYTSAREILVQILKKAGDDPARADWILYETDRVWRHEDRNISYWARQRGTTQWEEFRKAWAEHTRRGRVSFAAFNRLRRKLGARDAASSAGVLWDKPIRRHPGDEPVKADSMPALSWEARIGGVLIGEVEKQLGRRLKFSRYNAGAGPVGGPDLNLLVELFAVAKAERARPRDPDEAVAAQAPDPDEAVAAQAPAVPPEMEDGPDQERNPGSREWFAHMIERLRARAKSQR